MNSRCYVRLVGKPVTQTHEMKWLTSTSFVVPLYHVCVCVCWNDPFEYGSASLEHILPPQGRVKVHDFAWLLSLNRCQTSCMTLFEMREMILIERRTVFGRGHVACYLSVHQWSDRNAWCSSLWHEGEARVWLRALLFLETFRFSNLFVTYSSTTWLENKKIS